MVTATKAEETEKLEAFATAASTQINEPTFDEAVDNLVNHLLLPRTIMLFKHTEFIRKFFFKTLLPLAQKSEALGKKFTYKKLGELSTLYDVDAGRVR